MGLTFRKSVRVGPFRFNLSGSGIGVSTGIRGFRVGTGPKGHYVSIGRGGWQYKTYFGKTYVGRPIRSHRLPTVQNRSLEHQPTPQMPPQEAEAHPVAMVNHQSIDVDMLAAGSSEELLQELNAKRKKVSINKILLFLLVLSECAFGFAATSDPARATPFIYGMVAALIIAGPIWWVCYLRDIRSTRTILLFQATPEVEDAFTKLVASFAEAGRCSEVSYIAAKGAVVGLEKKYHSGVDLVLDLRKTKIESKLPPKVHSNVIPICLETGDATIYVFPDCLLVLSKGVFGSIPFDRLRIDSTLTKMTVANAPADATVVDHTWQYVNMKGGPDRRFRNNPKRPIVLYSVLRLASPSVLDYRFYFSRHQTAETLRNSLANLSRTASSTAFKPTAKT